MFDDFQPSALTDESRARFRNSIAAAFVLYGGSSAAIIMATATVQKIVEEKLTQVEFAKAPEPEPEPEPVQKAPPPSTTPRPLAKRPTLTPPKTISDEKLKESNKALAAAGEGGPVDGFTDGRAGGTGTGKAVAPPPPPPEPLVPPAATSAIARPRYPPAARRKGIEGAVVVMFEVLEDGRAINPQILSGPEELRDTVLKAVPTWRFRPAHRGAKMVRYRMKQAIVFRLEDA